jgi:enamine deaminase RidA (YjgF/YER057c/UK114 family)
LRVTRINPEAVAPPIGTYSHALRVESGDATWIYASGQLAFDPEGVLVGVGDLRAQTEQVFTNLRAIL